MRTMIREQERGYIAALYSSGKSLADVAGDTGRSLPALRRALRMSGVATRQLRKITEVEHADIAARYIAGQTTYEIARVHNLTVPGVCLALKRLGIQRRTNREAHPALKCNGVYFDVIDAEPKAYWLGFIAADGCVSARENGVYRLSISTHHIDREHLATFLADIESEGRVGPVMKDGTVRVAITNDRMTTALMSHGIVPRKSYCLQFPTTVPAHLIRHYIRGYFDGDGCVSLTNGGVFNFTGLASYLAAIQGILNREAFPHLGVRGCLAAANKRGDPRIGQLAYSKHATVAVYPYFYDGATRYLPRKHDKFCAILASYRVNFPCRH